MAFAIGYHKEGNPLEVLHILEYLVFNPENERVNVCGDFLVLNNSDSWSRLHVLHRGNIDFQEAMYGWSEDEIYTRVLKEIGAKGLGLSMRHGRVDLRHGGDTLEAELLPYTAEPLEELVHRPRHGMYVPFTGFKGPMLEPQSCSLFRVVGTVKGASYAHLMHGSDGAIELKGGKTLLEHIKEEIDSMPPGLSGRYRRAYQGFSLAYPGFHSFFLEFADRSPMGVFASTDIKVGRENAEIAGRRVTWLWADSAFNVYTHGYGPNIVLEKKPVEKGRVSSGINTSFSKTF